MGKIVRESREKAIREVMIKSRKRNWRRSSEGKVVWGSREKAILNIV